jgi:hypothetical protein
MDHRLRQTRVLLVRHGFDSLLEVGRHVPDRDRSAQRGLNGFGGRSATTAS